MIEVVVAIIEDEQGRILLTQRSEEKPQGGGLWEFPGGKKEQSESLEEALSRELEEELGIKPRSPKFLAEIYHGYRSHEVTLFVFLVKSFEGIPSCREDQQAMHWVNPCQFSQYEFPEANDEIIALLNGV